MGKDILECNKLIAEFMGYQILNKKYQTQRWCSSDESYWALEEGKIVCDEKGHEVDDEHNEPFESLEYLPFHYSWDWLMSVVEKIEDLDMSEHFYSWKQGEETKYNFMCFEVDIDRYSCSIFVELNLDPPTLIAGEYNKKYPTKKEAVWNAVVEFIEWYNKHI